MIGVSTLAALAQGSYRKTKSEHIACAIDARMQEVYWARMSRQNNGEWLATDKECVIPPSVLVEKTENDEVVWTKSGTGWKAYSEDLSDLSISVSEGGVELPEAQDIVVLAQFEWQKGNTVDAENASPVYLRDNVAWKKMPGRE